MLTVKVKEEVRWVDPQCTSVLEEEREGPGVIGVSSDGSCLVVMRMHTDGNWLVFGAGHSPRELSMDFDAVRMRVEVEEAEAVHQRNNVMREVEVEVDNRSYVKPVVAALGVQNGSSEAEVGVAFHLILGVLDAVEPPEFHFVGEVFHNHWVAFHVAIRYGCEEGQSEVSARSD